MHPEDGAMPATTTPAPDRDTFDALVERLSRQSVDKHFEAYLDVAWDELTGDEPLDAAGYGLWTFDPLGRSVWYRAQSPETQAGVGLHRIAAAMKIGWQFENLLQQGLLQYCMRLPNRSPEFRYLHHEIIEESQHTLMFQELVNRTGYDVHGMPLALKVLAKRFVVPLNKWFPELFFLFVLGGEEPVDHLQRRQLRDGHSHPLVERIMRIHVTEEARHIGFARGFLKQRVPQLSRWRRQRLALSVPVLLGVMAPMMVNPTADLHRAQGVPKEALRTAARSPEAAQLRKDSVAKIRRLCAELGLLTPTARWLWKRVGLWDSTPSATGAPAEDRSPS